MPATIYFSGSISGGRHDLALYQRIVRALEADGHTVLAGAVANEEVGEGGESLAPLEIFERDLRWLDSAEVVVAEVSVPSNGVGYEIAYARYERRIPVVALWRAAYTKRCSAMLSGDPGIELLQYENEGDLLPRLLESLRHLGRYVGRLP